MKKFNLKGEIETIRVGLSSCGLAAGGGEIFSFLKENLKDVSFKKVGCLGLCYLEPLLYLEGSFGRIILGGLDVEKKEEVIKWIEERSFPLEKIVYDGVEFKDNFLKFQTRIALRNCGHIDPEDISEYEAKGGYQALRKALSLTSEEIIEEVKKSGLRGRGGAGFPTGLKWEFTRKAKGERKYIICNADEGDPGAFMDRSVLEGDPHSVIEGMLIAALAIGAEEGYIYVRAEYPLALERLKIALSQAEEKGYLGRDILGKPFSFKIKVKEGAGAFVCGEETALISSIEGKRGMPRLRPPFPAQSGLWGKPTCINNVETLANIPWIILNGSERFSSLGTEGSKGTKVFALAGKIKKTGLVEVPMGTPLKEIIFKIGEGIKEGKVFKAVQIGGPSGGCLPSTFLDIPIDYEALTATGAIMGSGGMIVLDEGSCMVDLARYFLSFIQTESCGKCVPCRVGTRRMLEILERITMGKGTEEDVNELEELAEVVKTASLCGLGQTAPNPVLTTLKYFRDEYEEHVKEKHCPAGVCKELTVFVINEKLCTGCGVCKKHCPVEAIVGERKEPHKIIEEKCIRCGICKSKCAFDAIYQV